MFPPAGANIDRNEAGEPIGWDRPLQPGEEPYDPDDYLSPDDDGDYPEEDEGADE